MKLGQINIIYNRKREVSFVKSFVVEEKLLLGSFIYIKERRDPKMDLWGTPAVPGSHVDDLPLKTTLWSLWLRKLWIISNGRPVTPILFILEICSSCHTQKYTSDIIWADIHMNQTVWILIDSHEANFFHEETQTMN